MGILSIAWGWSYAFLLKCFWFVVKFYFLIYKNFNERQANFQKEDEVISSVFLFCQFFLGFLLCRDFDF